MEYLTHLFPLQVSKFEPFMSFYIESVCLMFGVKISRNPSFFHLITPFFDVPDIIPTVTGCVQPCFEP